MFVRSVVSLKRISAFLSTPTVSGLDGVGDIDQYREDSRKGLRRKGRRGRSADGSMGVAGGMRGEGTKGNVIGEEEAVIVFDNVTLAWSNSEAIPSPDAATLSASTANHSSDPAAAMSNVKARTNNNSNASSNDGDVYSFHKSLSALTLVAYHPQGHAASSTSTQSAASNASVSNSNHTTTSASHQPLITSSSSSSSSSHTTNAPTTAGTDLTPPIKPNQPTPTTTSSSSSSTVVLRNLNFTIAKGHLTVIVGTTGSGI